MIFTFSKESSNIIFLVAKRYESVAVHSNTLLSIFKLIPVNTGLDSWLEVANIIWSIIVFKTFPLNIIGFLLSSNSILGKSETRLQFK